MDIFDEKFVDFMKVFCVKKGQILYFKIVLRLKLLLKLFNFLEFFDVLFGGEGGYLGFGEIKIFNNVLLNEDGIVYFGLVNFRLSLLDFCNIFDIVIVFGDFFIINEDGEE